MNRRLFLTGPIGCGKSTAIAHALGTDISGMGGFFTRRHRSPHLHFTLESIDGEFCETFLDFPEGKPQLYMDVFSRMGVSLLQGNVLILDEIGGVELRCPEFMSALETILQSNIPVLGVLKGTGPGGALITAVGLSGEYEAAANRLRGWMEQDEDTLLYECTQFDENALILAENWVKEYAR